RAKGYSYRREQTTRRQNCGDFGRGFVVHWPSPLTFPTAATDRPPGKYSVAACHLLRGGRGNCYSTPGLCLPGLIASDRNFTKSIAAPIPNKQDRMAEARSIAIPENSLSVKSATSDSWDRRLGKGWVSVDTVTNRVVLLASSPSPGRGAADLSPPRRGD